jgi:hypothetical protein
MHVSADVPIDAATRATIETPTDSKSNTFQIETIGVEYDR